MRPDSSPPGGRALAVLAVLAGIAFLPSAVAAGFLNFDDVRFFGPRSELAAAGFGGVFDPTRTIVDAYLPVSHLSLWLDRAIVGDRPLWPHLHSLVLHVLVAFAVARLAFRLGLSSVAATAAGAVFLLHPAVAEAAMWVSSRKVLLAGLFSVLALSVLARHASGELARGPAVRRAALLALLAVYSNGTAIVLPALGAVVVWLAAPPGARRARLLPVGVVAVIAACAAVHHATVAAAAGTMAAPAAGLGERLLQVPGAFLHYLATTFWPADLNVLYPEVATLESFRDALVPGLLAIATFCAAVGMLARRAPRTAAGLALWALALVPFNTALPATSLAAADRYLYLALPGVAIALAAVPRAGFVLAIAAALPLGILANRRAADFESSRGLWESSLATDAENAVAMINLAPVLRDGADPFELAFVGRRTFAPDELEHIEQLLERAFQVARYPQHRMRAAAILTELARATRRTERAAHHAAAAAAAADELPADTPRSLGLRVQLHLDAARLARVDGDLEQATHHYEVARALAPDHPFVLSFEAALLLADAADEHGKVAADHPNATAAEALLDRAEAADPQLYEVHWTRGEWARATDHLLLAEKSLRDAIEIDPTRPEAWIARVDLFLAREDMGDSAIRHAREGLAVVDDPGLRFRLALALARAGRVEEAKRHYEAYLALRPNDRPARVGLAAVLAAIGMQKLHQTPPEALERLADRILELDPHNPKPLLMKAVAARGEHRLIEALVLLEGLRERLPEDREIERLYAETLCARGWQLKLHENRADAAYDHFVKFLAVAPPSVPTDAVRNAVYQEWRRTVDRGKEALVAGDGAAAEASFRRCIELRPGEADAAIDYFLGLAIYQSAPDTDAARLEQALQCFERAATTREHDERGLAVLYQVQTLMRLDRAGDARARAEAFLAAPAEADAVLLERIRDAIKS